MQRTRILLRIAAAAAAASLLLPPAPARADIAPPEQAPGSNIQPQRATRVQMMAERVVIEVLRVKGAQDTGLPIANVTASFTMRNTGSAAETMTVRFPLSDPSGQGDGFGNHPEIEQAIVTVNSKRTPTRIITTPNPRGATEPPIRWAAFDVTFPPNKDVAIDVQYILQSTGYMPYGRFKYILETGAGWHGPIGLATLILKLPYEANAENVPSSTPGGVFLGDEVRWTFKDIEPSESDNFYVTVLAPSVWQRILDTRRKVAADPQNAVAWRELAQAYLSAIFDKYGPEIGANFVAMIEEAYRRAQENDLASAQWHAEWAQVLLDLYPPIFELDPAIVEKIFAALSAAFERDPSNPLAQKVLSDLRDRLERLARSSGAEAETAKKQLEQLDRIAHEKGADQFEATPTAAPTPRSPQATTPEATPTIEVATAAAEPVITSSVVTSTKEASIVITATIVSTVTRTLTDTATSRPVVVVTIQESRTVTETTEITGTAPATVTEVSATTIITTTRGNEATPADGTVITSTAIATTTRGLDESGTTRPEASSTITTTTVTTATTEANSLEPTQPATVTVIVIQTTISPTVTVTRPAEAGKPITVETSVTSSVVTTATTGLAEPGAQPPPTSIITEAIIVTTTVEPPPAVGMPPITSAVTATTVVTATVDAFGVVTPGTPIIAIVTGALPAPPVTPVAGIMGTLETVGMPTSEATAVATETAAQLAAATTAPEAQAPLSPTTQPTDQGIQPTTLIALLLTYLIGGGAVYGVHSLMIRRDQERAAQPTSDDQVPDSTADQQPTDL